MKPLGSFQLEIPLPHCPWCWHYRYVPPHLASKLIFNMKVNSFMGGRGFISMYTSLKKCIENTFCGKTFDCLKEHSQLDKTQFK